VNADPQLGCGPGLEPNNRFEAATSLLDATAFAQNLAVCPAIDEDFYQVNLTASTRIVFSFDTTSTALRATWYDPNFNFLISLFDLRQDTIDFTAPTSGTYYLKVFGAAGGARSTDYRIILDSLNGYDWVPEHLVLLPQTVNAGGQVQFSANIRNRGNVTSPNFDVDIVLADDPALSVNRQVLRTEGNNPPILAGTIRTVSGKVDVPIMTVAGRYYLGVDVRPAGPALAELDGFNNVASDTLDVASICTPDPLEAAGGNGDNNNALSATALTSVMSTAALSICPGDEDWYEVSLNAGQQLTVDILFTHANGDLDLLAYSNPNGTPLVRGESLTDDESVTFTAPSTAQYFVRVRGFGSTTRNDYSLSFMIQ